MAQVTITINSREYAIACDNGQEAHIIKLSRMLDNKAKLLTSNNGQINENMLLAMVGLLLADELEDAKKGILPAQKPQIVEKIVEKVVEVEKPVEVSKEADLSSLDAKLSSTINQMTESLQQIIDDIEHI